MCEHVLLGKASTSGRKLHLPDPDEPDTSRCRFDGQYQRKKFDAVRDHYPLCHYCKQLAEDLE